MASEMTSTVSVNSSRERRRATCTIAQVINRDPAKSTIAKSPAIFTRARPSVGQNPATPAFASPPVPAWPLRTGISTSSTTVNMSSTISQPTATWPCGEFKMPASTSTRISTTVLATDIAMPMTAPVCQGMPKSMKTPTAAAVASRLWPIAPGMAMFLTASKSFR